MLYQWINTLLVSACICSLILYICPNGKMKELLEIGCSSVMLIALISPLSRVHIQNYASDLAEFRNHILAQEQITEEIAETLSRQVIEQEYAAYIINEARAQSILLHAVTVTVCQDSGNWIPYEVIYIADTQIPDEFKSHIKTQLGIPKERQHTNESTGAVESVIQ